MRTSWGILVALLSLFMPFAQAGGVLGTSTEPELSDPPGDVAYAPLYSGPKNRDWLDVRAFWIEYNATLDQLSFVLQVGDLSSVAQRDPSAVLTYIVVLEAYVEEKEVGNLAIWFMQKGDEDPECICSLTIESKGVEFKPTIDVLYTSPGIVFVNASRSEVAAYATHLRNPSVNITERENARQDVPFEIMTGSDSGTSSGVFDVAELRPVPGPADGDVLPSEVTSSSDSPTEVGRTVAIGAMGALAASALGVSLRRLRESK